MSSDWQYIEDHMGGHDEDGLPNFMSESGFSDDSYDDNYDEEDNDNSREEHEVGDTARLKSGGPLMTIEEVDDEVVTCRWFNKENDLKSAQFYKNEIEFDTNEEDDEDDIWYTCDVCDWNGAENELDEYGDCPECGSSVTEDA